MKAHLDLIPPHGCVLRISVSFWRTVRPRPQYHEHTSFQLLKTGEIEVGGYYIYPAV